MVRRTSDGYKITNYQTVHNHPCTASFMSTDVSRRRLSSEEMTVVQPFIERNTDVHEVMDFAHEKFSKVLLYNDIKNMRAMMNKQIGSLEDLLHRLRQTGPVSVLQDNADFVSKIIFARNDMIDLYHKFPEVVGIDSTYKTNKMGWPLYQFVVTDGFGRGRTVLFAVTRRERFADMKEILQTFKGFMGDISKTQTFTVDCATAQIKAIKEEFPRCSIILCLFHVCQAFRRRFPNQRVKKWLYRMAHTRSYDRFWNYLNLISIIDAEAGAYVRRYWLRTRKYWAASCNRFTISMGNNTNNRVENAHRQLKRYLRKGDPLELTLWKIWRWIDHTTIRKIHQGQWMLRKYYNYDVSFKIIYDFS
ncbi:unnamed protein product [Trichobilharzia szidati]|nr:unnamed protein product [Trichobilharzia szidati]CAH8866185.1 unnamed protein product [Trichobilharzia szidati]CAH8869733.1 unnamed protein product [Trichobilharzia szidati]